MTILPIAQELYPQFRYRLDLGERFSIVGVAERSVRIRPRLSRGYLLQQMHTRFVLDCEVTGLPREDLCTIASTLREITVEGELRGERIALSSEAGIVAPGLRRRHLKRFSKAIGDRFLVTKSLYGPIEGVQGGKQAETALGGVSLQSGLTWYGASFPRRQVREGERWTDHFSLEIAPRFLGLPGRKRHSVQVECEYMPAGWEEFQGLRCPRVNQALNFWSESSWGPVRVRTQGKGSGHVLPNLRDGKIARSQKEASFRVEICARPTRVALAYLEVDLRTDSWHE